jgi:hypothetical protein
MAFCSAELEFDLFNFLQRRSFCHSTYKKKTPEVFHCGIILAVQYWIN